MKKLIYVTGAGRGIGQTIAVKLAQEGYVVAGCARTLSQLEETQRLAAKASVNSTEKTPGTNSGTVRIAQVDVTDFNSLKAWFDNEEKQSGATPWGLITAAGIYGPIGPFLENDWNAWREGMEINLYGTALATKIFAQKQIAAKRPGRIVLLSGGGATQPLPNFSNYCASKSAVVRFGETVAHELKPHKITINSIAPGAVNTKLTQDLLAAGPDKAGKDMYEKALKQKEDGGTSPDKAAELTAYLMSDVADEITAKLISAVWDPWMTFHEAGRPEKLSGSDIFTLRRIVPEDRPKVGFTGAGAETRTEIGAKK